MSEVPEIRPVLASEGITVSEYCCRAERHAPAFTEVHSSFLMAFVRRGTFGYTSGGVRHDLVAGSLLLGRAGHEFVCSHEHSSDGDDCISFSFTPQVLDDIGGRTALDRWRAVMIPPQAEVMVWGALAAAVAAGDASASLEETSRALAASALRAALGSSGSDRRAPSAMDRRRAIRAAELIETRYADALDLPTLAADAGLGSYHFLRVFAAVTGVTPHQYLLRVRVARAASLLSNSDLPITTIAYDVGFRDLSGFVKTFRAGAGVSPRAFRKAARGQASATP